MMTQRERDKILIHLLKRWNATPDQFFWVNLPGRTPSITVIDYLHDPHQSYDPSNPAADQLLLPKDIAEQYRFFYKPLEPIQYLRIDDPQLCWRFSFGSKVRFHVTLKNLSGSTLLYLKATDLEYITVNMKIEAVQPKTQTITHKVYSSPISSVQSAILRKQPHSSHSPSENAYAKPFGNYGIRQELLKEFNRKEAEEKKEQAKLSSAPKSAAPVTSTKPEEKPSRDEGTITVKKGWKKERNQHVEHITPTVHTRPEEQPLPTGPKPEEVKVSPAVHKELPEPQELPPEDPDTEDETPEVSDTDSEEETSDESLTDSTASESAEEPEIEEDDSDFAENPESESEPAEEAADDENSDSSEEDASDREVRDILTKEQMLEALASMGFYSDPDAPDEETDEELSDHGELIEGEKAWDAEIRRIEGFIAERGGLYPKKLIETFTALMLTHDMVVLGGRSGTGKTSFCQRYAEAIGADVTIVPVKPNWMSTEDLLGYFNPVNGTYVSTLFRDALLQAAAHPEKMHLVVLDEMNIAIPEHYFADFLSRLEDRTVPEPEIVLPGIPKNKDPAPRKAQYAVCKVILSFLGDKGSDVTLQDMLGDPDYRGLLASALKEFGEAPLLTKLVEIAKGAADDGKSGQMLKIPQNVRFIGTINVDETTNSFSPKVLDRVHVLKMDDDPFAMKDDERCSGTGDAKWLDPASFGIRGPYEDLDSAAMRDPIIQKLIGLREYTNPLNIDLSMRLIKQALHLKNSMTKVGLDPNGVISAVIRSKILPRMVFDADSGSSRGYPGTKGEALQKFHAYLEKSVLDDRQCNEEASDLLKQSRNGDNQVNYWAL